MLRNRPFVTIKVALSRDGRMSAAPGARTALTGAAANRFVHRDRAEIDALAVGSGTMLCDDPLLTPRGAYRYRPLARIVFDTRLRTPPSARVLSTLRAGPVIIISTRSAAANVPERVASLRAAGADVALVDASAGMPSAPGGAGAGPDRPAHLRAAFQMLAARGLSSVLVEGGASLHQSLWDSGLVDRVQIFRTPHYLGPPGVVWLPFLATGDSLRGVTTTPLGADTLIEGHVHGTD
jgi:diaminohydroxyphosphoribosylaminopyrimidine deaminase/5-amino-6-(5-phosphoribosylamino)uracil reductase